MTKDEVLNEFREAGALLQGHFILSSGRHSETYLNKSIVSQFPERVERLAKGLAERIQDAGMADVDWIVSPAMGAIIFGYETARQLGKPFMFLERVDGVFALRRGFALEPGQKVLVVEDIISTGLSAREAVAAVKLAGGEPVGVAAIIDRSQGVAEVDAPLTSLARYAVESFAPDAVPAHLAEIPAVKPGSRGLSA